MIGRRRCLGGLTAGTLAAVVADGVVSRAASAPDGWDGTGPDVPRVTLLDQDERRWPLQELIRGRRSVVVSFFFSGCATLCPPQTAAMQLLQEALAARVDPALPASPMLLAISLDPFGDTPQAMRAYAGRFRLELGVAQGWLMLGGDPQALGRVWAAFDAPGNRPEQHTSMLWLGRDGGRRWRRVGALAPTDWIVDLLVPRSDAGAPP